MRPRSCGKNPSRETGTMLTNSGCPWSEAFVRGLSDKEERDIFVADQVRARIAQLVRSLREHEERRWTQKELGEKANKRQNVISRLENPDEAPPSVQTLLEIAAAFDLPLWIDFPEWEEWLCRIREVPSKDDDRRPFDEERLAAYADLPWPTAFNADVVHLASAASWRATAISGGTPLSPVGVFTVGGQTSWCEFEALGTSSADAQALDVHVA